MLPSNETGFKIERMTSTGSYSQIASVPTNIQTYTDTGLTSGTTYCYRVRAFNSAGNSAPSNVGCTTTPTPTTSGSSSVHEVPRPAPLRIQRRHQRPIRLPVARLSSKWNDYRVTMKIQSPDNDRLGVMFRYQDNDNYYRFSWHARQISPARKTRRWCF